MTLSMNLDCPLSFSASDVARFRACCSSVTLSWYANLKMFVRETQLPFIAIRDVKDFDPIYVNGQAVRFKQMESYKLISIAVNVDNGVESSVKREGILSLTQQSN